jgi:hypothetical protein
MAVSEDTGAPLGSRVVSPPLEVKKAVKTLSGILVVLIGIVRPLVAGFAPHWPIIQDPQTHETDLAVVNYEGAGGGAMFSFGIEEVSVRPGGLEDLRKEEIEVCSLDLLPRIRKQGDGSVSNGRSRWPPGSSACARYGGHR